MPVVIILTDGLSDPGEGRTKDLDPCTLSEIFARHPDSGTVRFYIVQAGEDKSCTPGKTQQSQCSRISEALTRFNIQLISAGGKERAVILSEAVQKIIRTECRAGTSITPKNNYTQTAQPHSPVFGKR